MDDNPSHYFLASTQKQHIDKSKSTNIKTLEVFTTQLDEDKQ